jgi:hypothetical protein
MIPVDIVEEGAAVEFIEDEYNGDGVLIEKVADLEIFLQSGFTFNHYPCSPLMKSKRYINRCLVWFAGNLKDLCRAPRRRGDFEKPIAVEKCDDKHG